MTNRGTDLVVVPAHVWDRDDMRDALTTRDFPVFFVIVRKYTGRGQAPLGATTGVPQPRISSYVTGKQKPTLETWQRIADGLHMPANARQLLRVAQDPLGSSLAPRPETGDVLRERLAAASSVDESLVTLLEDQTQNLRLLDRKLGAGWLIDQTSAHVAQIEQLMHYTIAGHRSALGVALTEAAALAGWQAIDLGRLDDAWRFHETGRRAARDADDPVVLAHVTTQQAYVLLDAKRHTDALVLMRRARAAQHRLPPLLRCWLCAAEAETLAACGQEAECRQLLDEAGALLPSHPDPELPFLALDETHLARWRGHCLARLGAPEAVDDLMGALGRLDGSFTRARTSLLVDLAHALWAHGDAEEARIRAQEAEELAIRTSSARQRRRVARLLDGS